MASRESSECCLGPVLPQGRAGLVSGRRILINCASPPGDEVGARANLTLKVDRASPPGCEVGAGNILMHR